MKEEKISKLAKILFPVAVLFFIATITISTLAVYKSKTTGESEIKIADWEIKLNGEDITTNNTFTFRLSDATWTHKSNINTEGETVQVVAPGSVGTYPLAINATNSEVDAMYEISIVIKQDGTVIDLATINPNLTVGVYKDNNLLGNPATGFITSGEAKTLDVKLIWNDVDSEEANESDTGLTNTNFVIEVTVVTKQKPILTAAEEVSISGGLVEAAGAKRYIGTTPENYVKFNCSNPNDITTCEDWRIIGVYGDSLKIIKVVPLENQQYNPADATTNTWEGSRLETYLNSNEEGGYYYSLTDSAKNMIIEGIWNSGIQHTSSEKAAESYNNAQMIQITRKVGLLAIYEYLYASEQSCWTTNGSEYRGSTCAGKGWIYDVLRLSVYRNAWTINPYIYPNFPDNKSNVMFVNVYVGYTDSRGMAEYINASPVVYLDPSVKITGGKGTATDPYTLGM